MTMSTAKRQRLLQLFAGLGAAGMLVTAVLLVTPWETSMWLLSFLGDVDIVYNPLLDYWMRMAAGAFTLMGLPYLMVAWRPLRYDEWVPWLGWITLAEGAILLAHGMRLGLSPLPFYADVTFCVVVGTGLLLFREQSEAGV